MHNLTLCRVQGLPTCCTAGMEPDMELLARQRVEQFLQAHVVAFRQTLDQFAKEFRGECTAP